MMSLYNKMLLTSKQKYRRAVANVPHSLTLPKLLKRWFRGTMDFKLSSEEPWRPIET